MPWKYLTTPLAAARPARKCTTAVTSAYLENRQGGGGQSREGNPCYLGAPARKGATGAHGAKGRIQGKYEGVLADGTFDE